MWTSTKPLSIARFIIEASKGLRNNSGSTVMMSMRIFMYTKLESGKGTKFKVLFIMNVFCTTCLCVRDGSGILFSRSRHSRPPKKIERTARPELLRRTRPRSFCHFYIIVVILHFNKNQQKWKTEYTLNSTPLRGRL